MNVLCSCRVRPNAKHNRAHNYKKKIYFFENCAGRKEIFLKCQSANFIHDHKKKIYLT